MPVLWGLWWWFLEFGLRTELRRAEALSQEVCIYPRVCPLWELFRAQLFGGRCTLGFFVFFLICDQFVPAGDAIHKYTGLLLWSFFFFKNVLYGRLTLLPPPEGLLLTARLMGVLVGFFPTLSRCKQHLKEKMCFSGCGWFTGLFLRSPV